MPFFVWGGSRKCRCLYGSLENAIFVWGSRKWTFLYGGLENAIFVLGVSKISKISSPLPIFKWNSSEKVFIFCQRVEEGQKRECCVMHLKSGNFLPECFAKGEIQECHS